MAEDLRGRKVLPTVSENEPLASAETEDTTILLDLSPEGRGVPETIAIAIGITGTVDADFTCGPTVELGSVLTDVAGTAMTNISASGTYWVNTSGIRFIGIAVNETGGGTFTYKIIN